jgi:precorrin-2 dehydrogenase / sirohydrochlorin ferrochelatase
LNIISKFLPIGINIAGKKILLIGGGRITCQKLLSLRQFTSSITVLAPRISKEIKQKVSLIKEKKYQAADLAGYFMVYACTDNKKVNNRIKVDAQKAGILVNIVDDPRKCDFISPALYKKGYMTVSVLSNGQNVKKSVAWRNRIGALIKNDQLDK